MKWHFDDFIYGSIDGAVTTFAIVAGVAMVRETINYLLGSNQNRTVSTTS